MGALSFIWKEEEEAEEGGGGRGGRGGGGGRGSQVDDHRKPCTAFSSYPRKLY